MLKTNTLYRLTSREAIFSNIFILSLYSESEVEISESNTLYRLIYREAILNNTVMCEHGLRGGGGN